MDFRISLLGVVIIVLEFDSESICYLDPTQYRKITNKIYLRRFVEVLLMGNLLLLSPIYTLFTSDVL